MIWNRTKKLVAAGAAVAAVVAGGGALAAAASPTSTTVKPYVTACYSTTTGALRVVGHHTLCSKGEKRVSWRKVGPHGARGQQGARGLRGRAGTDGTNGTNGTNGNTVLNGTGAPSDSLGANGDFYLDTSAETMYGPKANGSWPGSGTSLVGTAGTGTLFQTTDISGITQPDFWTSSVNTTVDDGQYQAFMACGYADASWLELEGGDFGGNLVVVGSSVPVTSADDGQIRIDLPSGTSEVSAQFVDSDTNVAMTITASASFDDVAQTCTTTISVQ
jgi:hypothetical protein